MADKSEAQARKAAEERLADARANLEQAQQEASEANQGLVAMVTQDVPRVRVRVREGQSVSDVTDQTMKYEGDTLELDGPSAIALMQLGTVTIEGEVPE